MTFESEGLLIVAIYTWLPPASYVVFSDNSGTLLTKRTEVILCQIMGYQYKAEPTHRHAQNNIYVSFYEGGRGYKYKSRHIVYISMKLKQTN